MAASKISKAWTEKPPDDKGVVPFIAREGLPLWKAMLQQGNALIDDVSTKAGSVVTWLFGGNTTGQSSSSVQTLPNLPVLALGAISAGMSAGSIVLSAGGGSLGAYAVSQTTAQSSSTTLDQRSLSLAGAGAVSVGYSAGQVVISAPNTISQTNQTIGAYFGGTTTGQSSSSTFDARSHSFSAAGGGISAGMSAGQVILSVAAPVPQTVQTLALVFNGTTTGQSSSSTVDARSLSFFAVGGGVSAGMSAGQVVLSVAAPVPQTLGLFAVGNTFSTSTSTSLNAQTISFRGSLGASVGFSAGSVIIAAPTTTPQSLQTMQWAIGGGPTTASTSTTFGTSIGLSGGFSNGASLGFSAGNVVIYAPGTQVTGSAIGNTTAQSATSTYPIQGFTVAGSGGVSVGYSAGILVISGATGGAGGGGIAAAAGTQTGTSGTIVFANSNGISFGMSGSSQITASYTVPAAQTNFTQKIFNPFIEAQAAVGQHGNGQLHVHPLPESPNFQFDRMVLDLTVNATTNTATAGSATLSMWAGFYTRNASTLSLLASSSTSIVMSQSNNTSSSVSYHGRRLMTLGWTTTISQQDLWLGIMSSSSTSSTQRFVINQYLVNHLTDGMSGLLGQSSNSTVQEALGMGYYSTTTGGIPATIAFSQLFVGGSTMANMPPFYRFVSQTA